MSDYSGRKILIGVVTGTLLSTANDKTSHLTDSQDHHKITILLEECVELSKTSHPPLKFIKECDDIIDDKQQVVKLPPIPTDVLFAFDSVVLTIEGEKMLDRFLVQVGGVDRVKHIHIVGHTDSTGNDKYNQALSKKRANSVADYWISQSVPSEKITQRGEGERKPIASNETPEGRDQNRRVEITIYRKYNALKD